MAKLGGISSESELSDVFQAFPKNSEALLRLLNDIMCDDGELTRGEREAVAGFISKHNNVPYCVFQHTMFSEVFSGPIDETNERLQPLLEYARCLNIGNSTDIERAFDRALSSGWNERAIYEVVEVSGIFNFINTIVRAAGLPKPQQLPDQMPTVDELDRAYEAMADAVVKSQ